MVLVLLQDPILIKVLETSLYLVSHLTSYSSIILDLVISSVLMVRQNPLLQIQKKGKCSSPLRERISRREHQEKSVVVELSLLLVLLEIHLLHLQSNQLFIQRSAAKYSLLLTAPLLVLVHYLHSLVVPKQLVQFLQQNKHYSRLLEIPKTEDPQYMLDLVLSERFLVLQSLSRSTQTKSRFYSLSLEKESPRREHPEKSVKVEPQGIWRVQCSSHSCSSGRRNNSSYWRYQVQQSKRLCWIRYSQKDFWCSRISHLQSNRKRYSSPLQRTHCGENNIQRTRYCRQVYLYWNKEIRSSHLQSNHSLILTLRVILLILGPRISTGNTIHLIMLKRIHQSWISRFWFYQNVWYWICPSTTVPTTVYTSGLSN